MKKTYLLIVSTFSVFLQSIVIGQGITCNPNTFWAFNTSKQVVEYELNNGVVTSNGVVVSQAGSSTAGPLVFSNNLNGSFSPTFYTSNGGHSAYYDYLYFHFNAVAPYCIQRYNGNSYTTIYSDSSTVFTVADMAVDDYGNSWFCIGTAFPNTDLIRVISPNGDILKDYPFSWNTVGAYGCFLLNGTFYIAIHNGNSGELIPVTFTENSAIPGTPIDFDDGTLDAASCNAGAPLSVTEHDSQANQLNIYPSIATESINCSLELPTGSTIQIAIIDYLGNVVSTDQQQVTGVSLTKIDVSTLPKGIYFVQVDTGKEKLVRRFLKQ